MKGLLKNIQQFLGIDGAISYTILGKSVGIFATLFTVFFIARYLSLEEQGYYYTFASILSIQIFFELGLNSIITQFVAHEATYLHLTLDCKMEGRDENKSRLSSLLRFCTKWYLVFAVFFLVALIVAGFFFFRKFADLTYNINWKLPWALLAVSSGINFLTAPINAFIQGLGKVKEIAKIRFIQQVFLPIAVWGGLMFGAKLFVSGLNTILMIAINVYMFKFMSFDKILINIWRDLKEQRVNYMIEVFPYQWKIALSWISGYFTFQLFNPILFGVEGAAAAGKMGMTISAANAIQSVLLSWINTKVPQFSSLIEEKKYKELDMSFISDLKRILFLSVVFFIVFVSFVYMLQSNSISIGGSLFGDRFLSLIPLCLMTIAILLQVPITAWATYLRCHLKEPFLLNSVIMGVLSILSAFILGAKWGTMGLAVGYLVIQFLSLIWAYCIFINKRNLWHNEVNCDNSNI